MLFNHVVFSFQIVLSSWLKYVMKEQNEQNEQKIIFSSLEEYLTVCTKTSHEQCHIYLVSWPTCRHIVHNILIFLMSFTQ